MSLLVQIEKNLPEFNLNVSFETNGGILGILGRSGSGKSMTLRCIAGLETPSSGRIILNGRVLFDSARGINIPARQRNVGLLFQNYALFPHLTVFENIGFGLKGMPKAKLKGLVHEKIAAFHLDGLEDRLPHQLSGGQQQRAAMARATIMKPELLLLDEPFSALDNYLRSQLAKELIDVLEGFQGTALFVSHNLDEAYQVCRDLMVLDNGEKIAYGERDEIFKNPPNFTTAQITGCHNLSPAKVIDSDTVEAADWGCSLRVARSSSAQAAYIGVRAHHVTIVDSPGPENVFPCRLSKISETPFSVTLYLALNTSPDSDHHHHPQAEVSRHHLQAEVFKEQWMVLKDRPFPWFVHLDPNHLFLTSR